MFAGGIEMVQRITVWVREKVYEPGQQIVKSYSLQKLVQYCVITIGWTWVFWVSGACIEQPADTPLTIIYYFFTEVI